LRWQNKGLPLRKSYYITTQILRFADALKSI
jgi:hypothetical protein